MPTLTTAKSHFDQDLTRAVALLKHAEQVSDDSLSEDLLRSSWMFGVGALDAYFSDAYADLVARTLRAAELEKDKEIPDRLMNLKIPIATFINRSDSWRWRMVARSLIEDENVLSIKKIKDLFNQFFPGNTGIIHTSNIEPWILHPDAKKRMVGCSSTEYQLLNEKEKGKAREAGVQCVSERMKDIFQRRHDCIHNCDRPKTAPQTISAAQTKKALHDINFLVARCHQALASEFPKYLGRAGFGSITRNRVLQ